MTNWVVKNTETGDKVSSAGSKGWAEDVAGFMNSDTSSSRYKAFAVSEQPS